MARRSRMSILKRQRELKKSEKAARKRAKRHGIAEPLFQEPTPTFGTGGVFGGGEEENTDDAPTEDTPETDEEETPKD